MTINNFNQIRNFLKFESSDEFYFIQILKRKKENPEISHHKSNVTRAIRTYTIRSLEYYDEISSEIQEICKATNSRAYIHLTKRSFEKAAFICLQHIAERCATHDYDLVPRIYNTTCGSKESRIKPYYWVVDIDFKDNTKVTNYKDCIFQTWKEMKKLGFEEKDPFIDVIQTLNGYHIISNPFNVLLFNSICKESNLETIDIHKNNPTLLYYSNDV